MHSHTYIRALTYIRYKVVDVGAFVQQHLHGADMPLGSGNKQGRLPILRHTDIKRNFSSTFDYA